MKAIKWLGTLLQRILLVLLAGLLMMNLYVLGAKTLGHKAYPTVLGYHWAVVLSGSMEPAISVDDLVITKARSAYGPGTVVTFRSGGSLTTHRIIEATEEGYRTQGDANNTPDANLVQDDQIIGAVVATVPHVGLMVHYLRTPLGMTALVFLALVLLQLPHWLHKLTNKPEEGK